MKLKGLEKSEEGLEAGGAKRRSKEILTPRILFLTKSNSSLRGGV